MKRQLLKPLIKTIAVLLFAVSTCWNFLELHAFLNEPPYREFTDVIGYESRFLEIKFELWRQGYDTGDIAYATARSFRGQPLTERDSVHWAQLRYVTIPFNLVQDLTGATYVLGDFTEDGGVAPDTPPDLIKLFDQGNGLVLYKRAPSR